MARRRSLINGSAIIGGNLTSANGAEIHGTDNSALDGVTITSGSTFSVDAGNNIYLTGDLTNHGTVLIGNSEGNANLVIDAPTVTLSGGGTVILNNATFLSRGQRHRAHPGEHGQHDPGAGHHQQLELHQPSHRRRQRPRGDERCAQHRSHHHEHGHARGHRRRHTVLPGRDVTNTNGTIYTDDLSSGGSSSSVISTAQRSSAATSPAPAALRSTLSRLRPRWRYHHFRVDLVGRQRQSRQPHRRPDQQRNGRDRRQRQRRRQLSSPTPRPSRSLVAAQSSSATPFHISGATAREPPW